MKKTPHFIATPGVLAVLLSACGGGGGGSAAAPAPVNSNSPGTMVITPSALTVDSMTPVTFSVHDASYSGSFSEADQASAPCANIAKVVATQPAAPTATFTVTPVNAGQCGITVWESNGSTATLSIVVTITNGTLQ